MAVLKMLLKFNVHLEAAVQVSADGYMIMSSDLTQLKAY